MKSTEVFDLIEEIGSNSSILIKQKLLNENIQDEMFKQAVYYAVNPEFVYGIVPDTKWINQSGLSEFDQQTFALLDDLRVRNLTGHAARDSLIAELNRLDTKSAELLVRIIRKDLRAGFGDKLINKSHKNLIPTYPYMRCSLVKGSKINEFNWEKGICSQLKLDGMFTNGNMLDTLQFSSRAGSLFPMEEFSEITESVKDINGYQTHGELLVEENGKILERKKGNGILNSVLSGGKFGENQRPIYIVWDIIPISEAKGKNKYKVPYKQRLALLHTLFDNNKSIKVVEYKICYSFDECMAHAKEVMLQGHEGTVIKSPDMIWEDGTSKYQIKIKVEFECDLQIQEILPGKVNTKIEGRAGALKCLSSDGLLEVNVTVKNEKMRDIIDANPSEWIGKIVPVIANDIMVPNSSKNKHSLFLPRLAEDNYRKDKFEADDLEKIKQLMKESIG